MALLETRELTKSYDAVAALQAVSLSVESGTVLGLIGENGAGKSTFAKCVTGLIRPTSGEILLEGRPVHGATPAIAGIPQEYAEKVVIAYEPIWAIGTGHTATPEQAEEMCAFIRGMMQGLYDMSIGDKLIIQYGGSMKPGNAKELLEKTDINGGLIGGASLKVKDFAEIAKTAAELAE